MARNAARAVLRLGRGALMWKIDVKSAFRHIPVDSRDAPLLGFRLDDKYYFERTLPFGLRSSPLLWDDFAAVIAAEGQRAILPTVAPRILRRRLFRHLTTGRPCSRADGLRLP